MGDSTNYQFDPPTSKEWSGWIERIAAGDEAALNALYDAALSRVYGLALAVTGNAPDAEEVVGDVFLQVWQKAKQFSAARGSVMAWLIIMTRTRALDLLRSRKTGHLKRADEEQLATLASDERSPEDWLEYFVDAPKLNKVLEQLQPVQRQLIALSYFKGMSHQELADYTEIPLGTVKTHLRRGLEALRDAFGGERLDD
ncbi:MAG TPA: sigma-70 family RNA polymerase sigma factor [Pseudomonadales bacterium]|nr:sigma-70 family RNA polymerase sigma factor [Pseudomonadales bacterium]